MNSHDFLDRVCGEIKYKSIHNAIRNELGYHIEETAENYIKSGMAKDSANESAVAKMGDAEQIGKMFNSQYRLPFNSRFGLAIWATIVTIILYIVYPFLYIMRKYFITNCVGKPFMILCMNFMIIGIIFVFMALNVLYLRRGRKIITIRDMCQITVGFMIGYIISAVILMIGSNLTASLQYSYPHYIYAPDVWLPLAPPYIPLIPTDQNAFAMQGFCWWLCIIVYIVSVKSRKEYKPSFILNCFHLYTIADGKIIDDFDTYMNGVYKDGTKMQYFGVHMDKDGQVTMDRINKNNKGAQ